MAVINHTLASWPDGGGGSVILVTEDVVLTVIAVKIVNGTVPVKASVTIDGITRGGSILAGFDQTFILPTPRPYTTFPISGGRTGFDFGITNISIA